MPEANPSHPSHSSASRYNPERLERIVFLAPKSDLGEILGLTLERPPGAERDRILLRLVRRFAYEGRPAEFVTALNAIQQKDWQFNQAFEQALPDLDAPGLRALLTWVKTQPPDDEGGIQAFVLPLLLRLARTTGPEVAAWSILALVQDGWMSWESFLWGIQNSEAPSAFAPLVQELLSEIPAEQQELAASLPGMTPQEAETSPESPQEMPWEEIAWDDYSSWAERVRAVPQNGLDQSLRDHLSYLVTQENTYFIGYLISLLPEFRPEHRQEMFNLLVLNTPLEESALPPMVLASATAELIQGSPQRVQAALRKMLRWVATSTYYVMGNYSQPIKKFKLHTLTLDQRRRSAALAAILAERLYDPCGALSWLGNLLSELDPAEASRLLGRLPHIIKTLNWSTAIYDYQLAECCVDWPSSLKAALRRILPGFIPDTSQTRRRYTSHADGQSELIQEYTVEFFPARAFLFMLQEGAKGEQAFEKLLEAFNNSPSTTGEDADLFQAWAAVRLAENGQEQAALRRLEKIEDARILSETLAKIAGYLSSSDLEPSIKIARRLPGMAEYPQQLDELPRDRALAALALRLAELGQPLQAVGLAWELSDYWRAQALRGMASHLDGMVLELAWRAAQDIDPLPMRLEALGALALQMAEPQRSNLLASLFDLARYEGVYELISATALSLPEALLPRAVQAAQLNAKRESTYACELLLPRLQGEEREAMAWYILSWTLEGGRGGGGGGGGGEISLPLGPAEVAALIHANLGPVAGGGKPPVKRRAPAGRPSSGGAHGGGPRPGSRPSPGSRPPAGSGIPAGVPGEASADAGDLDFGLTPADDGGTTQPGKDRRVINTGFVSQADSEASVDKTMPLATGDAYYFWLDVDLPSLDSIEESPTALPELPPDTTLTVTLIAYQDGLIIDPQACSGDLRQGADGAWIAARQPLGNEAPQTSKADSRLYFPVWAPNKPGVHRMRCNIYWGQVLLQSRLVSARCKRQAQPGKTACLHSRLDYHLASPLLAQNYLKLPEHRLSVLLNSNGDGTHSLHFKGSDGAHDFKKDDLRFGEGELQGMINQARGTLHLVSWDKAEEWKDEFTYRYKDQKKDRERLLKDLGRLAKWGWDFYNVLLEKLTDDFDPDKMDAFDALMRFPGYVQIALKESPSYILPVALIYDNPLVGSQAVSVCPEFDRAFTQNQDLESCACFQGDCPSRGKLNVLCPSGFWGFRHYLGLPLSLEGKLDAPAVIPYHERPQVLMGEYADFEKVTKHKDRLDDLPIDLNALSDLQTLLSAMKGSSHLLYFYCHGGLLREKPFLQFGKKGNASDMGPNDLQALRIRWLQDPHPLVILNGCHTSAVEPLGAINFLRSFLVYARAAGLIGTEITIFEELATEFGEELFRRLVAGQTVGEAVRGARLKLLSQGNPLGLVYTPFVNAGVHLEKTGS